MYIFVVLFACMCFHIEANKLNHLKDEKLKYTAANEVPLSRLIGVLNGDQDIGFKKDSPLNSTGCSCINYNCGCCADFDIQQIGLDSNVCVNASYLPDQYGISLTFSVDGKVYINETISAKNPPPVCAGLPFLEKDASICIVFYNLDISGKHFSGCVKLQFRFFHVKIEDVDLGCFSTFDVPKTPRVPPRDGSVDIADAAMVEQQMMIKKILEKIQKAKTSVDKQRNKFTGI